MANIPSSLSLQFSTSFPLPSSKLSPKPHLLGNHHHRRRFFIFTTRAQSDPDESSQPESDPPAAPDDDDFENRINQLRVRYRSGTGKKAEARKGRKSKKGSSSTSGSGVFLPPVPLKEPVSGGLKVDFGFSAYSERLNGRIAILGLTALLLVELATGKGVINYHTPAIILIQIYFVAAVSALYIKYEKEKISVWPESSTNK